MKYRNLSGTDLTLSEVGFGVWSVATSWWGNVNQQTGVSLLREAYDLGVSFFDTADAYGEGFGEEIIPKALGDVRANLVIGTKFGYDLEAVRTGGGHKERPQRWESAFIKKACENSLRRMQTDVIDLYQLHNPRLVALQKDEIFDALEQLKTEGKIRWYAAAIGPDLGWEEEGVFALEERQIPAQIIYSILEQAPARRFIATASKSGTGLLTRVPHASGMLDGSYTKDSIIEKQPFGSGDHRSHRNLEWMRRSIRKLAKLDFILENPDYTPAQAAIKFCLHPKQTASCLPTIVSSEQLREFAATSDKPNIEEEIIERLNYLWEDNFGEPVRERLRSSLSATGWTS